MRCRDRPVAEAYAPQFDRRSVPEPNIETFGMVPDSLPN